MYDVHLRLIGKLVVDFLLVLIELFQLSFMAEVLRAKIDKTLVISLQLDQFGPKLQSEGVAPNHSSCQTTRINDLSCGIRMCARVSFILSQYTCLTDRWTDRQKCLGNTVSCITHSCTGKLNLKTYALIMLT